MFSGKKAEDQEQKRLGIPGGNGLSGADREWLAQNPPGLRMEYALQFEEVYACLRETAYEGGKKTRRRVAAVLLAALFLLFASSLLTTGDRNNLFFAAVSLTLFFAVTIIPVIGMKMDANGIANGHIIHMELFEDRIIMGSGAGRWKIPLDGTSALRILENRIAIVYFDAKNMVLLPLRCVKEENRETVISRLRAGTRPRGEGSKKPGTEE